MTESNRMAALEWAADYAKRHGMFDQPLNSRGYPADGMKPPTPQEKTNIILRLATWAITEGDGQPIKEVDPFS